MVGHRVIAVVAAVEGAAAVVVGLCVAETAATVEAVFVAAAVGIASTVVVLSSYGRDCADCGDDCDGMMETKKMSFGGSVSRKGGLLRQPGQ